MKTPVVLADIEVAYLVGSFDVEAGCQCTQSRLNTPTPYTGVVQATAAFEPTPWQRFWGKQPRPATYRETTLYHHHWGTITTRCKLCRLLDHLGLEHPVHIIRNIWNRTLTFEK